MGKKEACIKSKEILSKLETLLVGKEQIEGKGQVILYGPPGTGKTWLATNYVRNTTGEQTPGI
ncbi:AAA family ATPase [Thermococcus sp. M36]|uniref:AAA family ATPase n=1 Tax=Thermococcus sp. M36 TaxID=1638261 RepID=UPI00143B163E|nr:AAA family ATPase [Thermococcus sp. M36]